MADTHQDAGISDQINEKLDCQRTVIKTNKSEYISKNDVDECTLRIRIWYLVYLFVHVLRLVVSINQMMHMNQVDPSTIDELRTEQKKVDVMQLGVWIYLNTFFNILMIVGNILYFSIDGQIIPWCEDVSSQFL